MNQIENEDFSLKEEKLKQDEKFLASIYSGYKSAAKAIIAGYDSQHPSIEITKKLIRPEYSVSFSQIKIELKELLENRQKFLESMAKYLR